MEAGIQYSGEGRVLKRFANQRRGRPVCLPRIGFTRNHCGRRAGLPLPYTRLQTGLKSKNGEKHKAMMVESDFTMLAHKVIENWRDEQTALNAGATEGELLAFEKRFALTLPLDFRYFYSLVNGMADCDMDNSLFSLWPLERIASEIERSGSHSEE